MGINGNKNGINENKWGQMGINGDKWGKNGIKGKNRNEKEKL